VRISCIDGGERLAFARHGAAEKHRTDSSGGLQAQQTGAQRAIGFLGHVIGFAVIHQHGPVLEVRQQELAATIEPVIAHVTAHRVRFADRGGDGFEHLMDFELLRESFASAPILCPLCLVEKFTHHLLPCYRGSRATARILGSR
jgi:hypothetical protein